MRPEALSLLVAELRKHRQADTPTGRLVNEAVEVIRLFRSQPLSVAAAVGLLGLPVAVRALTVAGMLTVLQLSAGDVWNLRARTQARREQAARVREQQRRRKHSARRQRQRTSQRTQTQIRVWTRSRDHRRKTS